MPQPWHEASPPAEVQQLIAGEATSACRKGATVESYGVRPQEAERLFPLSWPTLPDQHRTGDHSTGRRGFVASALELPYGTPCVA
jgi:hypothetical protein